MRSAPCAVPSEASSDTRIWGLDQSRSLRTGALRVSILGRRSELVGMADTMVGSRRQAQVRTYRGRMHPDPDDHPGLTSAHDQRPVMQAPPAADGSNDDRLLARDVLTTEYSVLMSALTTAWSASLTRTSLLLGVLSAACVAFGFASQGGVDQPTFHRLALLVLLLVWFLGIATFSRLVQFQRESMVYITGLNRIRHRRVARRAGCWSAPGWHLRRSGLARSGPSTQERHGGSSPYVDRLADKCWRECDCLPAFRTSASV